MNRRTIAHEERRVGDKNRQQHLCMRPEHIQLLPYVYLFVIVFIATTSEARTLSMSLKGKLPSQLVGFLLVLELLRSRSNRTVLLSWPTVPPKFKVSVGGCARGCFLRHVRLPCDGSPLGKEIDTSALTLTHRTKKNNMVVKRYALTILLNVLCIVFIFEINLIIVVGFQKMPEASMNPAPPDAGGTLDQAPSDS